MSAWDVPLSLAAVVAGAGAFIGFFAFIGACLLVEWWKSR